MRLILSLILLLPLCVFAQKSPVGILIKFDPATSFEEKQALVGSVQGLMALNPEQVLKGFEVTLTEGNGLLTYSEYQEMRDQLESSEKVIYTSLIFKSATGAIAADLQELYFKPKAGFAPTEINPITGLITVRSRTQLNSFHHFPAWQTEEHYFMKGVYVATYDKYCGDIRAHQAEMIASGNYEFVSVNTLHTVISTVDDPYFENQWALENNGTAIHFDGTAGADMSVPEAWTITTGDATIKVAVLDSGTDTNHVDLAGQLLPGFDATGGGSMGYPNTTYSNDGHGTCTAGIVAAAGNNGEGIAGVAYGCKVIPVKIFYYIPFGGDVIPFSTSSAGTDGIIWAVNTAKADVLSNSWGLSAADILLLGIDTAFSNNVIRENMALGREGKGIPMLFSSGNDGDNFSIWPASLKETISVGASTMCDEIKKPTDCSPEGWWGSNYGLNLDVTAPGVKVLSTDMSGALGYNGFVDNDYSMFNGTSAACPNAAGVMALILSVDPTLSGYDARSILAITADKTGGYDYDSAEEFGMRSTEMGYGRVNAYAAVYYASNFTEISTNEVQFQAYVAQTAEGTVLRFNGQAISELKLYNLQGQCIAEVNVNGLGEFLLNAEVLTHGLYFVNFVENGHVRSLKVVI